MNQVNIVTAQNVTLKIELANIGDRFLAAILDVLIKIGVILVFSLLVAAVRGSTGIIVLLSFLFIVFMIFYSLFFETVMNGQTPGKRMMKIRVAKVNGEPVDIGSLMLRWLLRIIDFPFTWPAIGIFTTVVTNKHQRLGDLAAGTILVSSKERTTLDNTFYTETQIGYRTTYPQADRLTAREAELIKEVIRQYQQNDKYELVLLASQKVQELLQVTPTMDDLTFLKTVLKDYNRSGITPPTVSDDSRFQPK
ncbi:MAG: hypothetical protein JWO06_2010 [Bacteroidota bacterium]|nr:hypothetical protein [Bacteroidota bacterium]